MKLLNLHIDRLAGVENLRYESLNPALNVIYGRNGVGKSMTCRAIQGLLWPERLKEETYPQLSSAWHHGSEDVRIVMEGSHYRREGLDGSEYCDLILPPGYLADCFTITIDDLFRESGTTEEEVLSEIRKQLAGGFDLARLKGELPLQITSARMRDPKNSLRDANQNLEAVELSQTKLLRDEDELPNLRGKLESIAAAKRRSELVTDALTYANCRESLASVELVIQAYPQGVGRVSDDDLQRLNELELEIQKTLSQLETARTDKTRVESESIPLTDLGAITDPDLIHAKACARELGKLEEKTEKLGGDLVDLQERKKAMGRSLGVSDDVCDLEVLDDQLIGRIERLHQRQNLSEAKASGFQAKLSALESAEAPNVTKENTTRGATLLREWLRIAHDPTPAVLSKLTALFWISVITAVSFAVILGAFLHPLFFSGLALLPTAYFFYRSTCILSSAADSKRTEYETLPLERPATWTPEDVTQLLISVELLDLAAKDFERNQDLKQFFESELSRGANDLAAITREATELANRIGLTTGTSVTALLLKLSNLHDYQSINAEIAGKEAERTQAGKQLEEMALELNEFLVRCGEVVAQSVRDLPSRIEAVGMNKARYDRLISELATANTAIKRFSDVRTSQLEKKSQIFQSLSLELDDRAGLRRLLEMRADYLERRETRDSLCRDISRLERTLQSADPKLLSRTRSECEEELAALTREVDEEGTVNQKIGDIDGRVRTAKASAQLENALVEVAKYTELLERRREEALISDAHAYWYGALAKDFECNNQNPVIQAANHYFVLFTNGRYELLTRLDDEGLIILAHEVQSGRRLPPEKLSRGTRMQLFLALRIGFLLREEAGLCLPIILDEALSSSDPERFGAIANCLLALTKEGRQLFYLTCQPADVRAWEELATTAGVECLPIDLEDRELQQDDSGTFFRVPGVTLPRPENLTIEAYIHAIGVPRFSVEGGSAAISVAHLVDDTATLYGLLSANIQSYGQLRNLISRGEYDGYVSRESYERMAAKARAIDAFAEGWSIGRGRRLSPRAIQVLCSGKTDEVIARAEVVGWNTKALLDDIDPNGRNSIPRFRRKVFEEFQARLKEEGYLVEEDILGKEDLHAFVLSQSNTNVRARLISQDEVAALFELCLAACAEPSTTGETAIVAPS